MPSVAPARPPTPLPIPSLLLRAQVGYTEEDLQAAGLEAWLIEAVNGQSVGELRDGGFTAEQLKIAGFSVEELGHGGFSATVLKASHFSARDLKFAGFSAGNLREADFSLAELKLAYFSVRPPAFLPLQPFTPCPPSRPCHYVPFADGPTHGRPLSPFPPTPPALSVHTSHPEDSHYRVPRPFTGRRAQGRQLHQYDAQGRWVHRERV